jgi:monoamine oxidase
VPPVDFSKQAVVAVFLGSRTTAGYSVSIERIEPHEDGVRVVYQEGRPAPGDMTAQVMTSPFHIVATATFAGSASFEHASRR